MPYELVLRDSWSEPNTHNEGELPAKSLTVVRLTCPVAKLTTGSDSRSQGWQLGGAPFVAMVQAAYFGERHDLAAFGALHIALDGSVLEKLHLSPAP